MNDAAEISAFIRDILLICFAVVGSIALSVIAIVVVKTSRKIRDAVDRANTIMDTVSGFVKTLASLRQTLASINRSIIDRGKSNASNGARGNAIGAFIGSLVRSIFTRRRRDEDRVKPS